MRVAFATGDLGAIQRTVNVCATLGGRFGWTPADRARLVVAQVGADDKPAARFLTA
jgi:hypothetical protein